jgi:hypothetical protein
MPDLGRAAYEMATTNTASLASITQDLADLSLTGGAGITSEEFTVTAGQTQFVLTDTNGVIYDVHVDELFQPPSSYTLNAAKNTATIAGLSVEQKVVLGYSVAAAGSQAATVTDQHSGNNAVKIWTGTEAEYAAIGTKDADTLYFCTGS